MMPGRHPDRRSRLPLTGSITPPLRDTGYPAACEPLGRAAAGSRAIGLEDRHMLVGACQREHTIDLFAAANHHQTPTLPSCSIGCADDHVDTSPVDERESSEVEDD
jgi:hypothetical protein